MSTSTKQTRERLARALARDWEAQSAQRIDEAPAPSCMTCGRSYAPRGSRFCSERCRESYDNGLPVFAPPDLDRYYTLPRSGAGFRVSCAHCRQPFTSHGLRCCSVECERALCKRQERDRELAGDPFRSPRPPCQYCGSPLPRWRRGREVSKATRFCSRKCRDRAARSPVLARGASQRDLRRETAKKCPPNEPPSAGDVEASVLARARTAP
jgi:hypothetical protein